MKLHATFALILSVAPASAQQWICVSEAATGFTNNGQGLVSSPYKSGRTYLIRPVREEDMKIFTTNDTTYVFEVVGNPDGVWAYFNSVIVPDGAEVHAVAGQVGVDFNPSTLKFTLISNVSFMFQRDAEKYFPFFEVGSCSKL